MRGTGERRRGSKRVQDEVAMLARFHLSKVLSWNVCDEKTSSMWVFSTFFLFVGEKFMSFVEWHHPAQLAWDILGTAEVGER